MASPVDARRAARAPPAAPRPRRARGRPRPLRRLRAHAADGRARAPLRRSQQRARLRAVPHAAARGAGRQRDRAPLRARPHRAPDRPRRLSGARACSAPGRSRFRLALAVDPVTVSTVISAPARAGVRLPAGHRQPQRVHRPLPRRLASDADRLGRPRRGRALSRQGAGQPLQLGRRRRSSRSSARTASSRPGARARTTASARSASTTSRRRRRAPTRVRFTLETMPATLSDRLHGVARRARAGCERKNAPRDAPAARDHRATARIADSRVTVAGG